VIRARVGALLGAGALAGALAGGGAAPAWPAAPRPTTAAPDRAAADEETARVVAAQLRCVVCQNLSVLDSPSGMAAQMRAIIRERLAAGQTPDEVVRYFVDKYGEWILLAPPEHGFTLLVWAAPVVAVLVGLAIVAWQLRRWTRPRPGPVAALDPALRDRIRRELEAPP
jgi:cytochrome c-type biogenesis protein CcmH